MFEVGLGYLWFTVLEPQGAVVQIDPVDGGERARIRLAWLRGPGFVWLAAMIARRVVKEVPPASDVGARTAPFAWQIAAYLLLGSGSFALGAAIQPLSWTFLPVFIGALCVSGLVGIAAFFVPAGLGVRDGAFAWILGLVLPPPVAILVAIAVRLWLTVGDVAAVIIGRALVRK